jgi:hypothetical protein
MFHTAENSLKAELSTTFLPPVPRKRNVPERRVLCLYKEIGMFR